MRTVLVIVISSFAIMFALAVGARAQRSAGPSHTPLAVEQEVGLGPASLRVVHEALGPQLKNPTVQGYVQAVGAALVSASFANKTQYGFAFHVVDNDQVADLVSLPDGKIFVTSATLRLLRNEAELAAVLGHAIGHVMSRHASTLLRASNFGGQLNGFGPVHDDAQQQAAVRRAVIEILAAKHSYMHETDADALATRFANDAGYDASALIAVLQRFAHHPVGRTFFDRHPNSSDRLWDVKQDITQKRLSGGQTGDERYQSNLLSRLDVTKGAEDAPRR